MTRLEKFAKAMYALHQVNLLSDKDLKGPVVDMIRKSTEPTKNWSINTHYRSIKAGEFIANSEISTAPKYHAFCRSNLSHEHMVPNDVIYKIICNETQISLQLIIEILTKYGRRAIITKDENRLLRKTTMPEAFYIPGHDLHRNPLARYIEVGLDTQLLELQGNSWFDDNLNRSGFRGG